MTEENEINVEIKPKVKSKKRAVDLGGLYTTDREVNAFGYNSENQLFNTQNRKSHLEN